MARKKKENIDKVWDALESPELGLIELQLARRIIERRIARRDYGPAQKKEPSASKEVKDAGSNREVSARSNVNSCLPKDAKDAGIQDFERAKRRGGHLASMPEEVR